MNLDPTVIGTGAVVVAALSHAAYEVRQRIRPSSPKQAPAPALRPSGRPVTLSRSPRVRYVGSEVTR